MGEVAGDDVFGFSDPIGIAQQRPGAVDQIILIPEQQRHRVFLGRDPLLAPGALVAQPQPFLRGIEQLAQKLRFPAVPGAGADRADIHRGQDRQIAQPFKALHFAHEILDRLGIGQIAFLRGAAHQQMLQHQPGDQIGLFFVQPKSGAQPVRHLRTQHRMIAPAPFGDIVQQHGHIQRPARGELGKFAGRARVISGQQTALDLAQQPDGADRVFIDGVVVIHIELHLRVDPPEIGHEAAKHTRFVHPAQRGFGILAARQQIEKNRIGALVPAQLAVDQFGIARRLPHGFGVDFQPFGLGQLKHFDEPHRIGAEPVIAGRAQPPAFDAVAFEHPGALRPTGEEPGARAFLGEFFVKVRQEHAGQAADPFHLQEIILHEPFDRAFAGAISKLHPFGHRALQIEGQAIFGAVGDDVHVAPRRQQEPFGAAETAIFGRCQQPDIDQFRPRADAVDIFPDPVERLQIAQAALAFLDVGFNHIAAVAHAFVPGIAFGQLLGEELALAAFDNLVPEPGAQFFVKRLFAPHQPAFEQRGADGEVFLRHPHRIADRAAGMADFQAQIPQQIQHRFDHLFAPRRAAGGGDEGDVEIGMRRHLGAPIPAHRQHGEPFTRRAIGHRIQVGGDVIVDHAQQLVHQERITAGDIMPGRRGLRQPPGEFGAPFVKRAAQRLDDIAARPIPAGRKQRGNLFRQNAAVDDRALTGNAPGRGHAGAASLA